MRYVRNYTFVLLLSLLPLIALFISVDMPHTHDGPVHLARIAAYYKALSDGQIFPRWAGDLNYGYGMPLFNFIYHTPYLVASIFVFIGFHLVQSFKLTVGLSYIISGIFFYAFAKALLKDSKKALLVTVFYQFAPFRLVDMNVRGSIGEMYAYAFLPLVLLGLTKIINRQIFFNVVLTSIATFILILSHNSISLLFFSVCIVYAIVFHTSKKSLLISLSSLLLGLLLASFYWIPAILEHKYTYGDLFMKEMYQSHFPPFLQFFIPNLVNSQSLQTGGISVQLGLSHTLAIILSIWLLITKSARQMIQKKIILLALFLTITSIFFMQPASQSIWKNFSLLRQFQFPWRLLAVTSFSTSLASVSFLFFPFFTHRVVYLSLIILTVLSTIYYWKPPLGFDKVTDENEYWNYPLNTTYFGETDVIWSAGPAYSYPKERIVTIEGETIIENLVKKQTVQTMTVKAQTDSRLASLTQYFPGWRVYIDNTKVPIQFQDQNWRGLITFPVPKGNHSVKITFERSKTQQLGEYISLLSASLLLGVGLLQTVKKHI